MIMANIFTERHFIQFQIAELCFMCSQLSDTYYINAVFFAKELKNHRSVHRNKE